MIPQDELELLETDQRCLCGHAKVLHAFGDFSEDCQLPECDCYWYREASEPWPRPAPPTKRLPTALERRWSTLLTLTLEQYRELMLREIHGGTQVPPIRHSSGCGCGGCSRIT